MFSDFRSLPLSAHSERLQSTYCFSSPSIVSFFFLSFRFYFILFLAMFLFVNFFSIIFLNFLSFFQLFLLFSFFFFVSIVIFSFFIFLVPFYFILSLLRLSLGMFFLVSCVVFRHYSFFSLRSFFLFFSYLVIFFNVFFPKIICNCCN